MIAKGDVVVCGLSGGADSVCLLLQLQELGYQVVAAHCNFHLRGAESDGDEVFVRSLCEQRNVSLYVKDFDTKAYAKEHRQSIEMAARELRYAWFAELCQQVGGKCVAVAHHRDDNVETLLLNLVRGTGLKGLCGMQPRNGMIIRPLLCVSRKDIIEYLEDRGQDYRIDSTNLKSDFSRNKLRLEVLPLLRDINAAADENIATAMENLNEAEKMYRYCVEEFVSASIDGAEEVNIDMVMRAPSPLSVLHEVLSPFGFNRTQLQELLNSIRVVGKRFYSPTHCVVVDREQLVIEDFEKPLDRPVFTQRTVVKTDDFSFDPSPNLAYFDKAKLTGDFQVRLAEEGDRFQPLGMKGTKLVSDFLTDLKVNRTEKTRQWVLTCGNEIAWVIGRRISERFRVDEATQEVVILTLS